MTSNSFPVLPGRHQDHQPLNDEARSSLSLRRRNKAWSNTNAHFSLRVDFSLRADFSLRSRRRNKVWDDANANFSLRSRREIEIADSSLRSRRENKALSLPTFLECGKNGE